MFLTQTQATYLVVLYLSIIVFLSVYILKRDDVRNINKIILMSLLLFVPILGMLINVVFMLQHKISGKLMNKSKL